MLQCDRSRHVIWLLTTASQRISIASWLEIWLWERERLAINGEIWRIEDKSLSFEESRTWPDIESVVIGFGLEKRLCRKDSAAASRICAEDIERVPFELLNNSFSFVILSILNYEFFVVIIPAYIKFC
jgi:hypothetical protein